MERDTKRRELNLGTILRRRSLTTVREVIILHELHYGVMQSALADVRHADLPGENVSGRAGRGGLVVPSIGLGAVVRRVQKEGRVRWGREVSHDAVGAGGSVDQDPVQAVVGVEVLAPVLVETAAAAHDGGGWGVV